MYTEKCVSESERHRGDAVCWLFCFVFFTFLCSLAVHVKCTVYHFSDCINRAAAVWSLCWPTPRHWTYKWARLRRVASVGGIQKNKKKTDCRSERLRLVSSDWYHDLTAVGLGRPTCCSVQPSKLGTSRSHKPPFTSSWTWRENI